MMVLYTPLSYDDIFPSENDELQLITFMGKSLYVKKNEQNQLEVVQLLSTNPNDFLQRQFQPGTIVYDENVHN